jgi:hypothetical protein
MDLDSEIVAAKRCCPGSTCVNQTIFIDSDAQCADGHTGALCAACKTEEDYVMGFDGMCEFCAQGRPNPGLGVLVLFLICLVLFLVVCLVVAATKRHGKDDAASSMDKLSSLVVLIVGYGQIMSSITETCSSSTSWGADFSGFSQMLGFVNLDATKLFPAVSCSLNFDFRSKLYLHFATPLAIVGTIKLAEVVAIAITSRKAKARKDTTTLRQKTQKALAFKIMMNFLLLIYPSLTKSGFAVFRCVFISHGNDLSEGATGMHYLERDFAVECHQSGVHRELVGVAVTGLVVYGLGIPACLLLELFKKRLQLHDEDHMHFDLTRFRLGTFFKTYEARYFYWEVVVVLVKMVLVGMLGIVEQYSPVQLMFGSIVCVAYTLLVLRVAPYESDQDDWLAFVCMLSLSITYISGLLVALESTVEEGEKVLDVELISSTLVVVGSIPLVFFVWAVAKVFMSKRGKVRNAPKEEHVSYPPASVVPIQVTRTGDTADGHNNSATEKSKLHHVRKWN